MQLKVQFVLLGVMLAQKFSKSLFESVGLSHRQENYISKLYFIHPALEPTYQVGKLMDGFHTNLPYNVNSVFICAEAWWENKTLTRPEILEWHTKQWE